ncbi:hypothetical protein [Streptomyces sp. NRRL S-118]|uniref:hypothetical protein n=1 Tax=Streptomyces sp. NRRL S-118 TaxID=1463881 RepID=UPI0004C747DE|nr:hypothetical protein [Streptomyces sp. NRRL S-118]
MNIRHARTARRTGAAALLAASLLFTAACGGGEGTGGQEGNKQSSEPAANQSSADDGGQTLPDKSKTLATLKGDKGLDMVIHEAKRDQGGFLTVSGEFKNTSGSRIVTPVQWSGQEREVASTGPSLAAMTLVDSAGKKRYYVLRDTDNRPLTTTGYDSGIDAGKSLTFFAQFPAPPASTTTVDLQFPGFPNAPIEIS